MKIVIAILALASAIPVAGGEFMTYQWPEKISSKKPQVCKIDVLLDIAYYVHLTDQGSIKVYQDTVTEDPDHNYKGCKSTSIQGNVAVDIQVSAKAVGASGGAWIATISPTQAKVGTTKVTICVTGKNVQIEQVMTRRGQIKVAQVTVKVSPRL